jgi:hypothetical protein
MKGEKNMSETTITIARMRPDGTVVEVLDDGTERPFPPPPPMPEMTDRALQPKPIPA